MTVPEYEARIAATERDIEPLLSRSCGATRQCQYFVLAGLCEPRHKPYSMSTTDAAALAHKVAAFDGIRHAFYGQGTRYPCPAVIYPEPAPLACMNSRCE